MVFKKMLQALGVGGPTVDTIVHTTSTHPGGTISGVITMTGGNHDVELQHVTLALTTTVEVESGDQEGRRQVEFFTYQASGPRRLAQEERAEIPFSFALPWETPLTHVFGNPLHGMTLGVRTTLAVAKAVDKGDLDPLTVEPLPAHATILEAFARLGFRFKGADLEAGHVRGSAQTLPFYQEIEFFSAPQYAAKCQEVELTFITTAHGVDVMVEADKKGGFFGGGGDVYLTFHVPHDGAEGTDWAAQIDQWFQSTIMTRGGFGGGFGQPQGGGPHGFGTSGQGAAAMFGGHQGPGKGQHGGRRGPGFGAVAGGVAAGAVGGMMLGGLLNGGEDEASDGESFGFGGDDVGGGF